MKPEVLWSPARTARPASIARGPDRAATPLASSVVPATHGYFVLNYHGDKPDGGALVTNTPIVAWRVEGDCAMPITPDPFGDDGLDYNQAVQTPNNSVIVPCGDHFENEQEWIEDVRAQMKDRK
jgi:hypothetical protein